MACPWFMQATSVIGIFAILYGINRVDDWFNKRKCQTRPRTETAQHEPNEVAPEVNINGA